MESPVVTLERTGSTMDDAMELARQGCPTGTVVVAGYQDKGRGRVPGRVWLSPPWESLLATVVIRIRDMACPLHELPLRAGTGVARAVEETAGIRVGIKWPNDLVVDGRKLAGLLCEARGEVALVGLGVNCLQRSFPPEISDAACSLLQLTGRGIAPLSLLLGVRQGLRDCLDGTQWRQNLDGRLAGRGSRVTVDLLGSGRVQEGVIRGIDDAGRLLLETDDNGIVSVAQGEISAGR
jgi:BirA family transcriptional regulator, biotin operon repressor / biotin---[acetyl-CoA-carboxylase] ligase